MYLELLQRAKNIYYKHISVDEVKYPFLWGQASEDYRQAFINIAKMDIEDEDLSNTVDDYDKS